MHLNYPKPVGEISTPILFDLSNLLLELQGPPKEIVDLALVKKWLVRNDDMTVESIKVIGSVPQAILVALVINGFAEPSRGSFTCHDVRSVYKSYAEQHSLMDESTSQILRILNSLCDSSLLQDYTVMTSCFVQIFC